MGEYRAGLARALEDTSRIELLVRDMLLLSSIEHARKELPHDVSNRTSSLRETLIASMEQVAPLARMHKIVCRLELAKDSLVQGSQSDLSLLWTNLLENAIQHSPEGAAIVIETEPEKDCHRVRIIDPGEGISCIDLPHVFERFYRADRSRSRATGGFGLGLSIAKAIVDHVGGTIQISSVPAAGTTVAVTNRSKFCEAARQKVPCPGGLREFLFVGKAKFCVRFRLGGGNKDRVTLEHIVAPCFISERAFSFPFECVNSLTIAITNDGLCDGFPGVGRAEESAKFGTYCVPNYLRETAREITKSFDEQATVFNDTRMSKVLIGFQYLVLHNYLEIQIQNFLNLK